MRDILEIEHSAKEVSRIAEILRNDPDPQPWQREEYKKALQRFLNMRAGLIYRAHNEYKIPKASKEKDIKLSGDPLLSPSEIVQINAKIVPTTPGGFPVKEADRARLSRRKDVISLDQLEEILKDAGRNIQLVQGVPEHWTPIMPYDYRFNDPQRAELIEGLEIGLTAKGFSPERAKKIAEASFFSAHLTGRPDTRLRYKDSTGNYPGTFTLGYAGSHTESRAATDAEIVAIMQAADNVSSQVSPPGTIEASTKFSPSFQRGADVLITVSGQEHAVHASQASGAAAGYASRWTGVTLLVDRVREAQRYSAKGTFTEKEKRHSSIDIDENTTIEEYVQYVFTHELGHTMHFGYIDDNDLQTGWTPLNPGDPKTKWRAPAGLEFVSDYGMTAPHEYFAESFAKYMITGVATPEFLEVLRSRGMLKSQKAAKASDKPLIF